MTLKRLLCRQLFVAYLPELGTDLVTTLSSLNVNDFSHIDTLFAKEKVSNASVKANHFLSRDSTGISAYEAIFGLWDAKRCATRCRTVCTGEPLT